ncbi:Histidinol-phosphatase [Candidatus Entotheonellaceae bacterium PAL068K]
MQYDEFTAFIHTLAEKSGAVIGSYFTGMALDVEIKDDQSPVTRADREAEALMRDLIRRAYPQHGIMGEEFGSENTSAEFVWVLDPIDGTISYTRGCPLFGTLIGLLHANTPILGAIHQPLLQQLCIGNNTETTVNGRVVQLQKVQHLSEAMLLTTDITNITKYHNRAGFDTLLGHTRLFRTWGDCYGYMMLVSGGADIMLDPIMHQWDILPLIPVIRGANGVITTWSGTDAAQGNSCIAANKTLHPHVVELLNS